jgi:hypothetical protein
MRFQINIDCTPEEARKFFGVPDILPLQQALMEQVNEKIADNIKTMEPEMLMQTWVPAIFQGWAEMQKDFFQKMTSMGNVSMSMGETPAEDSPDPLSKKRKS